MDQNEKILLLEQIELALNDVRPHLAVDGGNVELVDVDDSGTVFIRWQGNCESCNMSLFTMKAGLEQAIKNKIPQIVKVEALNGVTVA